MELNDEKLSVVKSHRFFSKTAEKWKDQGKNLNWKTLSLQLLLNWEEPLSKHRQRVTRGSEFHHAVSWRLFVFQMFLYSSLQRKRINTKTGSQGNFSIDNNGESLEPALIIFILVSKLKTSNIIYYEIFSSDVEKVTKRTSSTTKTCSLT